MEKSVEALEAMFQKADSDLNYLSRKVEFEFENVNTDGKSPNPAKMLEKINDVKKEYAAIAQDALEIQKTQKEAMDYFRSQLLSACQMVQKLGQQSGVEDASSPDELSNLAGLLNIDINDMNKLVADNSTVSSEDNVNSSQAASSSTSSSSTSSSNVPQIPQESNITQSAADLRSGSKKFLEVSEEEFNSVSDLIKGRVKLADVNSVYQVLWRHFKEEKNKQALKTADLHKMGCKVSGATEEAKLKVLRSLKLIQLSSKGEVLLN